jgi:hypothetical protein
VEEGRRILARGLTIIRANTLAEAAERAVAAWKNNRGPEGGERMSILLDRTTPVLVQGITGKIGSFHAKEMMDYGTNIVGGVTPARVARRRTACPSSTR